MNRDGVDDLARQLFSAARRQAPSEATARRVSGALAGGRRRTRALQTLAVAAVGLAAIAAGAVLVPRGDGDPVSISMEPPATGRDQPVPAPEPAIAPSIERVVPPLPRRSNAPVHVKPATLADELASLNRARAALGAGNPASSLSELDRYDRALRGTALRSEATLLRIEALLRLGRRDEASAIARRFIEHNPHDPLVDRARALAAQVSDPIEPGTQGRSP